MTTAAVETLRQYGLTPPSNETRRTELGQQDFLNLMTAQLRNQDPLKPLGSTEFVAQLAQFSTVSGIENLQQTVVGLANVMGSDQLLGAAGMIGKHAIVESDTLQLEGEGSAGGAVGVTSAGTVTVTIKDASGAVVKTIPLGAKGVGMAEFSWDGIGADGTRLPPGKYTMTATVESAGKSTAAMTFASARIDSVSISTQGPVLNLAGIGPVPVSQIFQIGS
jgi:flagellar basal-body rod modification protein FlgD